MNPVESATSAAQEPAITPDVLRAHDITTEEYERILKSLGRTPTLTELGIFSVMWSEHCSYKSSRVHLKRLPTRSCTKRGVAWRGEAKSSERARLAMQNCRAGTATPPRF